MASLMSTNGYANYNQMGFFKGREIQSAFNVLLWKNDNISFNWDRNQNISVAPVTLMNHRHGELAKDTETKYILSCAWRMSG